MAPSIPLPLLLLAAFFSVSNSAGFESNFKGEEYISYDLRSNRIATETNHISMQFKTFHPSGLVMHSSGTQGDFVTLEMIHGKLRLTIDLGNTRTMSGKHHVIVGENLDDNKWHTVKVARNQRSLLLTLDNKETRTNTAGSFVRLDLDKFIFVGGVDRSLPDDYHGARDAPNFKGCLKDVYFDFIDILYGAQYELLYYSTYGRLSYICPLDDYTPVGFPSLNTHLRLTDLSPNNFTVWLSFRTYSGDGVLAFKMSTDARVYLSLVHAKLELEIRIGTDRPIKISLGENLNDGLWHDVTSGINRKELWLTLDDKPEVRHANPWLKNIGKFRRRTYIGSGTQKTGFVGCMNNIKLNGALVRPRKLSKEVAGAVIGRCSITSKCFPNPCQNGGACKESWDSYTCDCQGTFYEGATCEVPLYRSTCEEYKTLGISEDSYCKVDPDGKGPLGSFAVMCNMTNPEAKTVVSHNKQMRQEVTQDASNFHGFYFHHINYQHDLASIRALIVKSKRCRQYISFNCFNTLILNAPNGPAHAQWLSRTGVLQNYWGGAPADRQICACGVDGTCADPTKYCNCDIGDSVWREDAGYLRDKNALPVSMLQFTEDASRSYFTLGPLECFGYDGTPVVQHSSSGSIMSSACRPITPSPTELEPSAPPFVPTAWISKGSRTAMTENTDKGGGLTIQNTITTKGKTVTLPPVTPTTGYPSAWGNSSIAHVTRVTEYEYSEKFIVLVVSSVIALVLLVIVVVILLLRRSGRTYISCAVCKRCRNKRSIPEIEIYRHSMYSDSPEVLQLEDMRPSSVELGAYNLRNGQAVYHSVHQTGSVKKFVSFSSSTAKI
ncbi:contactin-associated protein-like 2 isoform X2 [Nematostella vectensis]|uniref:contactin-associated protein-like 2 isoform X2 n=1 Tax=Nematostella vectensis TaxID=45351 RepID=UPI002076D83A|nr:contactin-associated protein-like 2 isoform X2 [Nematostella vectensis]